MRTAAETSADAVRDWGGVAAAVTAIIILIGLLVRTIRRGAIAFRHASTTYLTIVGGDGVEGLDRRTERLETGQSAMAEDVSEIKGWQEEATQQLARLNEQLAEMFEAREKP